MGFSDILIRTTDVFLILPVWKNNIFITASPSDGAVDRIIPQSVMLPALTTNLSIIFKIYHQTCLMVSFGLWFRMMRLGLFRKWQHDDDHDDHDDHDDEDEDDDSEWQHDCDPPSVGAASLASQQGWIFSCKNIKK